MNDDQLMTAVRESFGHVHLDVPLEQTVRRGRALRGRGRAHRVAGVAGVAAIAGVTTVAVTGLGRTSPEPTSAFPGTFRSAGPGGAALDAWTVTTGPNGTVTITIRQLFDAAGLQRALRADGVPARVAFQSGLPSDSPPLPAGCKNVTMSDEANANLQAKILGWSTAPVTGAAPGPLNGLGIALTIYPKQIPRGVGIYLAVQSGSNRQHYGWGLDLVRATPDCTG
jgi:hypothetical protein